MRMKITRNSLLITVYILIILNVILGMVFKFIPSDILRKIFLVSKVAVLASLVLSYFVDLFKFSKYRISVHVDSALLIFFVIYELYISKIRGLLIFPDAYLDILIWPLVYIIFKNYTRKNDIPKIFGRLTEVAMIIVLLLSIPLIIKHRSGFGDVGGVIFYVYYCITFLPMVLYTVEKDKVKNVLFLFTILILVLSTKRSGTIVAVVGYAIYLFTNVSVRRDIRNKLKRKWKYILGFCVVAFLIILSDKVFSFSILSRLRNIGIDRGSGREAIWIEVIDAFTISKSNIKIFGHGFQAVYYQLKPYGIDRLAHNSFIEFLYDYGYIGLGIFLGFLVTQLLRAWKAVRRKNNYAPEMLYSILVAVVFGLTSYFFEESAIIVPIAAFWGCISGESCKDKSRILKRN